MTTYQRPGVYVQDTLTPTVPVVASFATSVASFIGGADRGPTVPTLVTSWNQYVSTFGGYNSVNNNDLPDAVQSFFTNGGGSAYIVRAVGDGAEPATLEILDSEDDLALTISANSAGTWGNDLYVTLSNVVDETGDDDFVYDLVIFYGGVTPAYSVERFSSVSNSASHPRYVETVLGGSKYVSAVAAAGKTPLAVGPTPTELAGGDDGDSVDEELIADSVTALDVVPQSLILNGCGVTTASFVNQLITYAEARADVFVLVDPSAETAALQITAAAGYSASAAAAVYYPKVVVPDLTSSVRGASKTISPSGAVAGLFAVTDTSRGVYKAAAGLSARLGGVVSVAPLTNSELDAMNVASAPVNAIRFVPGSGIVVMGARTLKNTYLDKYIPVRRSLAYLRKTLSEVTQFAVFESNDARLWRRLEEEVTKELTRFWQSGGLRGDTTAEAFFVKCDEETNTLASIDAGEVNIEVGVALQRPAEFVIIKIGQFEGGTTVTVA